MIEKLKKKIDFNLLECKFVERNNLTFLDIEIDYKNLNEVEEKSKIISDILDEIDNNEKQYYLNVYSSGAEKNINWEDVNNFYEKYIQVILIKPYLNSNSFEGELIDIQEESLKLLVNLKGCFRKLEFQKSNIKELKQSIKLTKKEKEYKDAKQTKPTRFN
ncbi:MAG: hypothetical protein KFW07_02105 [Mycoplasmataceae bacterium]|nr:hypothetical protein [Mycoplasmataceae bacterium]